MAKVGRLAKLKSAMKRWPSFTKVHESAGATASAVEDFQRPAEDIDLHEVYVGKSRRKYMVSSDIISNPVFQELVDRSSGSGGEIVVTCEVVLFEHLIWMLKNSSAGSGNGHGEFVSVEELAELYTCN